MKTQTGRIDSLLDPGRARRQLRDPLRARAAGGLRRELRVDAEGREAAASDAARDAARALCGVHQRPPDLRGLGAGGRGPFRDGRSSAAEGTAPATYTSDAAAAQLRAFGETVRNQIQFWNAFWTIPMGTYGPRPGSIPGVAFPRNAFNTINAASAATGRRHVDQSLRRRRRRDRARRGDHHREPDQEEAELHRLPARQSLGRVARVREPLQQPQRSSVRRRRRRRDPPRRRPRGSRRPQLARHDGPAGLLHVAALGLQQDAGSLGLALDLDEGREGEGRARGACRRTRSA